MSVNFPEEDGVEHRAEPQMWPVDGDAEAATPEPDAFGREYGLNPDGPAADSDDRAGRVASNGVPSLPASAVQAAEGYGPGAAQAAAAQAAAPASKVTAPFSMLTKSRTKPPRPAKPAKTAKPASNQKK